MPDIDSAYDKRRTVVNRRELKISNIKSKLPSFSRSDVKFVDNTAEGGFSIVYQADVAVPHDTPRLMAMKEATVSEADLSACTT